MTSPLLALDPALVFRHFDEIRKIPRGSKNETQAAAYVRRAAERAGFGVRTDEVGNLVVDVPATPGKENAPVVVLQGHLDMVNEKNAGTKHDFDRDPIDVYVDGDWIRARGTTLGSDNGIGVAAALAVAEDRDAIHGPLELLFTIDEETGMTGAMGLKPDMLKGRMLLNLDTEEENAIYIGCAGGADVLIERKLTFAAPPKNPVGATVKVAGLRGGHSGVDIHEQRGNAVRILARVLEQASSKIRFYLADLRGGSKRNAIPREASATVVGSATAIKRLRKEMEKQTKTILEEIGRIDPDLVISVEEAPFPAGGKVLPTALRKKVLDLLLALPNGVEGMSYAVPGLVETSTNLATVEIRDGLLHVGMLSRSSAKTALDALNRRIHAIVRLGGGSSAEGGGYPGWKPDPDSRLLKTAVGVHERVLGVRPTYKAIHAGLECGVIGEKFPGMQMISFGPRIEGAHSPDERLRVSSVAPFYKYLKALLAEIR